MLVFTPVHSATQFFPTPKIVPRSLTWSDMHHPLPLPSRWSNMSAHNTNCTHISLMWGNHHVKTTQAKRLLYLSLLPCFSFMNSSVLTLLPSSPYLLHSLHDITSAAPPSSLPQGGERQKLREGVWNDLREGTARSTDRKKTRKKVIE